MPFADMPEQDRLAKAVIRRLAEGAGTGNRAAAIVEPVADDVPIRDVAHPGLPLRSRVGTYHSLASPLSHEAAPSGARGAPPPPISGGGSAAPNFRKDAVDGAPPPRSGGGGPCEAWWRGRVSEPLFRRGGRARSPLRCSGTRGTPSC